MTARPKAAVGQRPAWLARDRTEAVITRCDNTKIVQMVDRHQEHVGGSPVHRHDRSTTRASDQTQ